MRPQRPPPLAAAWKCRFSDSDDRMYFSHRPHASPHRHAKPVARHRCRPTSSMPSAGCGAMDSSITRQVRAAHHPLSAHASKHHAHRPPDALPAGSGTGRGPTRGGRRRSVWHETPPTRGSRTGSAISQPFLRPSLVNMRYILCTPWPWRARYTSLHEVVSSDACSKSDTTSDQDFSRRPKRGSSGGQVPGRSYEK